MTIDTAATLAVSIALDEPTQMLAYLKQICMQRMDAVAPIDAYLAKQWCEVVEGIAATETRLQEIKRPA